MEPNRSRGLAAMVLGVLVLYVGWANVEGLVPPFALCGYIGDPGVHFGDNLALMYSGGCAPYELAHEAFVLTAVAGSVLLGSGLRAERRYR